MVDSFQAVEIKIDCKATHLFFHGHEIHYWKRAPQLSRPTFENKEDYLTRALNPWKSEYFVY